MKFSEKDLDVLVNLHCYESRCELAKNEMDQNELYTYSSDWKNLEKTVGQWFCEQSEENVKGYFHKGRNFWFFFPVLPDCDKLEFIKKLMKENPEIATPSEVMGSISTIIKKINKQQYGERELELLSKIKVFDDKSTLAKEQHTESDLEEYISFYGNLSDKFEEWFFTYSRNTLYSQNRGVELYIYIDSDDVFIPKKLCEYAKFTNKFIEENHIVCSKDFEVLKKRFI